MAHTYDNVPRWASLTDGTTTYKFSLYEALKYSEDISYDGGEATIRMLDGGLLKQANWAKRKITLAGSGGLPPGFLDLDYRLPITLSCGTLQSQIKGDIADFDLPTHRTDTGYEPQILKYVGGIWVKLGADGVAEKYMALYYPVISCFFDRPGGSYKWDDSTPSTWSLTGQEI